MRLADYERYFWARCLQIAGRPLSFFRYEISQRLNECERREMKVSDKDIETLTCRQATLARLLSVTPPRIHQLIEEKIVIRNEGDKSGGVYLVPSLMNFYLSKKSTGAGDEANFWREKNLHEKAKRELTELKLAKERNQVYDAATVEHAMIEQLSMLRSHLLALGQKLSPQLERKKASEIAAIIDREMEERLMELSNYEVTEGVKDGQESDRRG